MPMCSPSSRPSSGSPTSPSSRSSASSPARSREPDARRHHRRRAARDRPGGRQPRQTFGSRAMALQLHAGEQVVPQRRQAGALHGLRQMPRSFVEITVPEDQRRRRCRRGVGSVRTSWIDPERDVHDATRWPPGRHAAADAVPPGRRCSTTTASSGPPRTPGTSGSSRRPTPPTTWRRSAAAGECGVTRFERWLEKTSHATRPSQSGLELDVLDAMRRAGLPEPERQHPLDAAHRRGRSTSTWPGRRPARRRARPQLVARRRPRPARRPGPGSGLRRDRLAHRPPRRVAPGRAGRLRAAAADHPRRAPALAAPG